MKKISFGLVMILAAAACTKYRNVDPKGGVFVAPVTNDITFGSLRINEFICKGSDAGAVTHFHGATAKWFELYNPTSFDITLAAGQWYVTDDLTSPTKFAVPTNTTGAQWKIPAGGFIGVLCVKDGAGGTTGDSTRINTHFSLSSSSGGIGVFYQKDNSSPVIAVDTLKYNFGSIGASSGVSYGRKPDGQGSPLNPLSKVTPEASNN